MPCIKIDTYKLFDDLEKRKNLAAGAICIRPDDFMLNISSFYIAPEYRGKGGGRFLLDETKRLFGKKNMEFNVEFLIYDKEQEDFANFLEHYGFMSADPEYDCYITTVGQLKNAKLYGKEGEGKDFSSISPQTFKLTENNAENNEATSTGMKMSVLTDLRLMLRRGSWRLHSHM